MSDFSPDQALLQRAVMLHQQGQLDAAAPLYRAVLERTPGDLNALHLLGVLHQQQGRAEAALALIGQVLAATPGNAVVHNNYGNALKDLGRFDAAAESYRQAMRLDPGFADARYNLGRLLKEQGAFAEAAQCLTAALALEPRSVDVLNELGLALQELGRFEEAVAQFQAALALAPGQAELHYNLGTALSNRGRREAAEAEFAEALRRKPDLLAARANLAAARLPIIYRDEAEIDRARAIYGADLAALVAAPLPTPLDADAVGGFSPFYLAYQGRPDRELQALYGAHVTRIMASLHPHWMAAPEVAPPRAGEKIRVGLLSAYFHRHSNWKIPIKGWLAGLDPARFELYLYHIGRRQTAETAEAAALCHRFAAEPRPLASWAETIRADRLHVLLIPGIGLDTLTTRLAALKLAPVQASSWGHPETSGLPSIDHFLSSELMEPPDGASHYTETLIRLPNLSIAYEPAPATPAAVSRSELGVPEDATLYWCCQSLFKYLPRHDSVFPRIALADPAGCFVFIAYPGDPAVTAIFKNRLDAAFAACGLDAAQHCRFLPQMGGERFAGVTRLADLFLDSIGWSGCNTTLEALALDVPVITTPGSLMRGRHSAAILTLLGLTELIAPDPDAYADLAAALGRDPARRAELRQRIARDKHRLYRDSVAIDGLAQYLTDAAHRRIRTASADGPPVSTSSPASASPRRA